MEPELENDSMQIRKDSRVKYRHGRGYALGTVLSVGDGFAAIQTKNGATINRRIVDVTKADPDFIALKTQ